MNDRSFDQEYNWDELTEAEYLRLKDVALHYLQRHPPRRVPVDEWGSALLAAIANRERARAMTRTMYDSTDPNNIPQGAQIVCYYPHAWGSDMTKHHDALQIRIDNHGDHADDCHVLDVENGAASVQVASLWIQSWHKLHTSGMHAANGWIRKPVIYCSESVLPSLRAACAGLDYDTWGANWSTGLTPIAGCFAKQYADRGPNGENYDMSVVYDDTWGKEPAPAPAPAPAPQPAAFPRIDGMVHWADNSWNGHARLVHSDDGGHTWS
jgi:hypothetical protein